MSEVMLDDSIESQPLYAFSEKAYLDYSMYVILDRALPHLGDGLKPVQRRIVYAMSELGLKSTAKYKKSARTVGDVLGKFHPHGDTACYEAMVLMAQSFSYRYPLVDGQGNWGAADDPKSFAAMRYTESRLTAYADLLLKELGQGTVNWQPNFDGTLNEPEILPARLPNILLNGVTGIAVGMATDIPPHNLCEVANACLHLLDNPKATLEDVCEFVQGPDFPTEAEIITPKEDILKLYRTGNGSIRMRATYQKEDGNYVIQALPHQVSGAKVLEQIAAQMQAKKLPMVMDLRDESDEKNPTRLVIVPRSNRVDTESLMTHLFATTDLERTYRVNMNVIGCNGRPQVKGLVTLLTEWLSFRKEIVTKRLQHRLEKVEARLHLLEGLLIVYLNLDEVIRIIRTEDEPKPVLIKRFQLSNEQADAILDTKLRHLAKLEEMKIRGEQSELSEERDELNAILGSPKRLKTLIRKELKADMAAYGDDRRSPIVVREEAQAMDLKEVLPAENVTVILSQKGWVRCAKGHDIDPNTLNYRSSDGFSSAACGRSNQNVLFLDSTGRSYALLASSLPSARGQGEPLTGRLKPASGAEFVACLMGDDPQKVVIASDAGYGFITQLNELQTKNRAGKALLKLPTAARPLPPMYIEDLEKTQLAMISNEGRLLVFPASELPELPKGKGNKLLNIPSARAAKREEFLIGVWALKPKQGLKIASGKRFVTLKGKDLAHYIGERGRRGAKLPRGYQRVSAVEVID